MANWFQRAIYNLSNIIPLLIVAAIAWWYHLKAYTIPVILLSVAIIFTVIFLVGFSFAKKKCSIKDINVSKIVSKDRQIVTYVIMYILPIPQIDFLDYKINLLVFITVSILILVLISMITALPNFILYCIGYHFYELETETGVSDYLLISKRKSIRKKEEVKTVMRVFEKLLIDVGKGV